MPIRGKYRDFLELLEDGEMLIEEICEDMEIDKKNIHRYLHLADKEGLEFKLTCANGGLHTIQLISPIKYVKALLVIDK